MLPIVRLQLKLRTRWSSASSRRASIFLHDCTSVYRWRGKLEDRHRSAALIKTRSAIYADVEAAIRSLHPYELPEIVAVPVEHGSAEYLEWVNARPLPRSVKVKFSVFWTSRRCCSSGSLRHSAAEPDLLEPDKAFRFSATADRRGSDRSPLRIAPGYYLYRDKFKFQAAPACGSHRRVATAAGQSQEGRIFRRCADLPGRSAVSCCRSKAPPQVRALRSRRCLRAVPTLAYAIRRMNNRPS